MRSCVESHSLPYFLHPSPSTASRRRPSTCTMELIRTHKQLSPSGLLPTLIKAGTKSPELLITNTLSQAILLLSCKNTTSVVRNILWACYCSVRKECREAVWFHSSQVSMRFRQHKRVHSTSLLKTSQIHTCQRKKLLVVRLFVGVFVLYYE